VRPIAVLFALGLLGSCRTMSEQEFLERELSLVRPGVDLPKEEREVRRVLRQRHLDIVNELRGPGFVALGAASLDGSRTAVRVITARGVVIAEDASADDLFAPAQVALLDGFGPRVSDYLLVAFVRTPRRADRGCVSLSRVLADGHTVPATLDVAPLGSRACISSLTRSERGRVRATVAWPALSAKTTPELRVELAFETTLAGHEPALSPTLHLLNTGPLLDSERMRLAELSLQQADFSERHDVGVALAALAQLAGFETARQLTIYRQASGDVPPGSPEAEVRSETLAHIENGWLDDVPAKDGAQPSDAPQPSDADPQPEDDALVIEPEASPEHP
jgi:hypothetical protein